MKKLNTRAWVLMGLLAAISIILTRFLSFMPTVSLRFGLGYVPYILAAIWLGPIPGALVGFVADTLGALLFYGEWFPPLTLVPVLVGLYSGFVAKYYRRNQFSISLLLAALSNFPIRVLLASALFSVKYGQPFVTTLIGRVIQISILTVAEMFVIYLLQKSPVTKYALGSDAAREESR